MKLWKEICVAAPFMFAALALGAIAYDQYDNHRFAAEYQHHCDTQGC